jgi:dimethylhistidine N-methyltransferase
MTIVARQLLNERALGTKASEFATDVVEGLTSIPKRIPAKYFYDQAGSELFEQITRLPEYYPTRSELWILEEYATQIARHVPPNAAMIEFGAGASTKARVMLQAAPQIAAYVPVDISGDYLAQEAERLRADFPQLEVWPVAADFTRDFPLPDAVRARPKIGFYPGSTIGNFEPREARHFLSHAATLLGSDARMIVGVDLVKDPRVLNAAYNDAAQVTAAFNLNLLARINRELSANFDLQAFRHQAHYNHDLRRIEMHLVSRRRQTVEVAGVPVSFQAGESIHTENSYKYTVIGFGALARSAGWETSAVWTDPDGYFSVHMLARG